MKMSWWFGHCDLDPAISLDLPYLAGPRFALPPLMALASSNP
jgi:hypothetical protein